MDLRHANSIKSNTLSQTVALNGWQGKTEFLNVFESGKIHLLMLTIVQLSKDLNHPNGFRGSFIILIIA